jgi:hypothetical protein
MPENTTLQDVTKLAGGALKFTTPPPKQPHPLRSIEPPAI